MQRARAAGEIYSSRISGTCLRDGHRKRLRMGEMNGEVDAIGIVDTDIELLGASPVGCCGCGCNAAVRSAQPMSARIDKKARADFFIRGGTEIT